VESQQLRQRKKTSVCTSLVSWKRRNKIELLVKPRSIRARYKKLMPVLSICLLIHSLIRLFVVVYVDSFIRLFSFIEEFEDDRMECRGD
jgi:hypothetical protein